MAYKNQSKPKVAIYLSTLSEGGAERVLMNLAGGFAERGHPVDFVLAQAEGAFMPYFPQNIQLVELNPQHIRRGRSFYTFPALIRYIRSARPSVMLTAMFSNIFAIWAKKISGVPFRLVISEQNTFSVATKEPKGFDRVVMPLLVRLSYPYADEVTAVSEGAADDLAISAKLKRERVRVIYNPVITSDIMAKAKQPLEHPWFSQNEPPVILAVGRLTAQKDYPTLLHAFKIVQEAVPVRLLILGEGEDRAELTAMVNQLNLQKDVSMPGFVPNPYQYMARAAVFVMSSRWEGLPTVLIEALYCGAPLVSTDCPSGPREILRDGKYGRLVPMAAADQLADALLAALREQHSPPPPESWRPYELSTIIDQYSQLFWG